VEDIEKSDRYPEVLKYVNENRLSIVDAYKLVYADRLTQSKTEAVKQQAINNVKSQQHLKSTDGGATTDGLVPIPEKELEQWQKFYPEKSNKELRELYNKYLHK
jgi:Tfp pilus assembly protein FimT